MTALNSWLTPTGVAVMTDTLMTSGDDGRPAALIAKAYPIPHISALISGRGSGDLIAEWAYAVACRTLVNDFDMLVSLAPPELAKRWDDLEGKRPDTTTVFAWGWSAAEDRMVGYAFRSGTRFAPERLEDGVRCAPGLADTQRADEIMAQGDNLIAMRDVMIAAADESRTPDAGPDKCEIGGEIVLHIMQKTEEGIITTTSEIVHRFPDRDVDYARALTAMWEQD